jgi:hypothetical protein
MANLDLKLQTGDKVHWFVNKIEVIGVVLEDLENGNVEIMTHSHHGSPSTLLTTVEKFRLELYI